MIDGISFIEKLSFNAFYEGTRLKHCVSLAKKLTGEEVKKIGGMATLVTITEHSAKRTR